MFCNLNCKRNQSLVKRLSPTPEDIHESTQSFAESIDQASFSIGQNRSLNLFLSWPLRCSWSSFFLLDVSSSWMFDSHLQEPKYVRSKLSANGQPDRGRNEGVFRLSGSLWFGWC